MTREIKFRGKRLDNGSWETGGTAPLWINTSRESWHITDKVTGYLTPVNPETVGQFTGLYDKNGKEIYEGDVVYYVCDGSQQGIVIYDNFGCVSIEFGDNEYWQTINSRLLGMMEIIGNIHDNPELIHQNKLLSHE